MSDINVTPLVDIVLVLLVVVLVVAQVVADRTEVVPVDLPKAGSGRADSTEHVVEVTLDREGNVSVDGTPCSMELLPSTLTAALAKRGSGSDVFLRADAGIAHGQVVALLDRLQALGISTVSLETQPK